MEKRLAKLERTNRWLMLAMSVLCLLAIIGWSSQVPPKEIRAQGFVLVDSEGNVLGTFGIVDGHPGLRLGKYSGKPHVIIGADDGAAALMISNGTGDKPLLWLTADNKSASLKFAAGGASEPTATLFVSSGLGGLSLVGDASNAGPRADLAASSQESGLVVKDGNGRARVLIDGKTGGLQLFSEEGKSTYRLPPPGEN